MKFYLLFLILFSNLIISQNYFLGKKLYCETENVKAKELFDTGIETLYLNTSQNKKYLSMTADVFYRAYKLDNTFCDAIFFAGYTSSLIGERKTALACYYVADSISNNKSLEFKVNLAAEALKIGNEFGMKLARKKYNELIQYFPESPEGYYGFAITSPEFGDYEKGLENLNIAIEKYSYSNPHNDLNFIKGILLTLNKRYDEALSFLEKSEKEFKKDFNFKIHYSLCLLKVSESLKDEKMKEKALKIYNKIENKEQIPEELKKLFVF